MSQFLSHTEFKQVVKNTPLFSLDFVIMNDANQFLLGLRNNSPAKGYWFVPGGRILKDESFRDGLIRILSQELGICKSQISKDQLIKLENPKGRLYIHHYPNDNFFESPHFHTHYIVFPIKIYLSSFTKFKIDEQHNVVKWMYKEEILADKHVHLNSKNYFIEELDITEISF